jgi:hypothetical protein
MTELIKTENKISKGDIDNISQIIIGKVSDGIISGMDALTQLKCYEKIIAATIKQIMPQAIMDVEKYGKEKINQNGFELSIQETGTSYDYSCCSDKPYNSMQQKFDEIKSQMKERELFLKSISKPMSLNDEETGEAYDVYPPCKKSTTSIICR